MGEGRLCLKGEGAARALVSEVRGISRCLRREASILGRDLGPDVPGVVPVFGVGIVRLVDDAVTVVLGAGLLEHRRDGEDGRCHVRRMSLLDCAWAAPLSGGWPRPCFQRWAYRSWSTWRRLE